MNGLFSILILSNLACSSLITPPQSQLERQSANTGPPSSSPPNTCLHDRSSESPVTAYPGGSCAHDVLNLIELLPKTPYPLSCPPTPRNSKCFPITESISTAPHPATRPSKWADLSDQSALSEWRKMELRSRESPSSRPRRQRGLSSSSSSSSSPTTTKYTARSVSLTWPDGMTHAVFYVDEGCEYVDDWRQGEVSFVARRDGAAEQCVKVWNEGVWGSVEFLRRCEWEEWVAANF